MGTEAFKALSSFLNWVSDNILTFFTVSVGTTIYIHSIYGEESTPLIIGFWAAFVALVLSLWALLKRKYDEYTSPTSWWNWLWGNV